MIVEDVELTLLLLSFAVQQEPSGWTILLAAVASWILEVAEEFFDGVEVVVLVPLLVVLEVSMVWRDGEFCWRDCEGVELVEAD